MQTVDYVKIRGTQPTIKNISYIYIIYTIYNQSLQPQVTSPTGSNAQFARRSAIAAGRTFGHTSFQHEVGALPSCLHHEIMLCFCLACGALEVSTGVV